jgi:Ca2+-transporting ATPase
MHLVLLELLFDPLCSIVFEGDPSEADAMARPPRSTDEPLFGLRQIGLAVIQGGTLLAVVLLYYSWLQRAQVGGEVARTSAFIALVSGQLALAVANGSTAARIISREHLTFWLIVGVAVLLLGISLTVPFFVHLLRFSAPTIASLLLSAGIGAVAGGWSGILLRLRTHHVPLYAGGDRQLTGR